MSTARVECVFNSLEKVAVWTELVIHAADLSEHWKSLVVINSTIQIARPRAQSMVFVGK